MSTPIRDRAQQRANAIGEPVMVITDGVFEYLYEGDPMDLRAEYRIVTTVEPE